MKYIAVFITLLAVQIASAQIPQTISYQGVLIDINGKKIPDGEYAVTFKLYTVLSCANLPADSAF